MPCERLAGQHMCACTQLDAAGRVSFGAGSLVQEADDQDGGTTSFLCQENPSSFER